MTFPFIGNDQNINPWKFWTQFSQQAGFININNIQAGDVDLERKIIENVAGYGRQLGILMDFMAVLAQTKSEGDFQGQDLLAFKQFQKLIREINHEKARHHRSTATEKGVDRLLEDMKSLKEQNDKTYNELSKRLLQGLSS